jgi:hypothetical protein
MRPVHLTILSLVLFVACSLRVSAGPFVAVTVSPAVIPQGGAIAVTVRGAVPDGDPRVRFASQLWPLYRVSDGWRTYLGTDPATLAGLRPVLVEIAEPDGVMVLARQSVTVRPVSFPRRHVTFDPETFALLTPKAAEEEHTKVAAALQILEQTQLWTRSFKMPVVGPLALPVVLGGLRFTSFYGVLSIYQGEVHGWHSGVDIAAPEGQLVYAANDGVVRLAEPLPLSGMAVIVDHGMGVLTMYFHMSAIEVVAGQHVRTGDVVGRVGSTGLATGPHLHWGLRVNGVYVDPLPWTKATRTP